ncbi:MAG: DNA polymerase III subunit alpha [Limnochordales bacterium]|nr:DNA polymerase III subunit alpha [Limnochordales bacterium]
METGTNFVHLHVHSYYTLLDATASPEALAQAAARLGYRAMALTDRGSLYGAVRWQKAAQAAGIRPLFGALLPVLLPASAPGTIRPGRESRLVPPRAYLLALVENEEGWQNLCRLLSWGATRPSSPGQREEPLTLAELSLHAGGLIFLTGPEVGGWLPELIRRSEELWSVAGGCDPGYELGRLVEAVGAHRLYVEVERLGLPGEERLLLSLRSLARQLRLPVVATHDVRYLTPEDAEVHQVVACIREGVSLMQAARFDLGSDQFYLKSPASMAELFADWQEALARSVEIAERCRFELPTGILRLPAYPSLPAGETAETYLERLCREGLKRRPGLTNGPVSARVVEDRLRHELDVIGRMGYAGYFLIVWDVVRWAKSQGIPIGPGRGSVAGSLVAYLLGITQIDPLRYDLVFERFLNPHRVSPPDIDVDIADDRRGEVLQHVIDTYGRDRVAQIITFGSLAARAAVRDVGRVLQLPPPLIDRVARLIPVAQGMSRPLAQALGETPELQRLYHRDPSVRRLLDLARKVEGIPRHQSVHAAGVVIAPEVLTRFVPVEMVGETLVTQFDMESLEYVGLLKIDFLALRHLSLWDRVRRRVQAMGEEVPELEDLDLNDPAVYTQLATGDNPGVFQLDSPLNRRLLPRLRPTRFTDIVAALALGRPGPMAQLERYLSVRQGRERPTYLHPLLEPILAETYGIVLYQEQVIQIAQVVAGMSAGEADLLRRAMGKKDPELMASERERFISGAVARGIPTDVAEAIFAEIANFAGYGFNKSHAAAYALLAFGLAWLLTHYPLPYFAELLTDAGSDESQLAQLYRSALRRGVRFLPVDVNRSQVAWSVEGNALRPGLASVPHVGERSAQALVEAREAAGDFRSEVDLELRLSKLAAGRQLLAGLAQAGALRGLGGADVELSVHLGMADWRQGAGILTRVSQLLARHGEEEKRGGGRLYVRLELPAGSVVIEADARFDGLAAKTGEIAALLSSEVRGVTMTVLEGECQRGRAGGDS